MAFEFKEGNNKMLLYQTELKKSQSKLTPSIILIASKTKTKHSQSFKTKSYSSYSFWSKCYQKIASLKYANFT